MAATPSDELPHCDRCRSRFVLTRVRVCGGCRSRVCVACNGADLKQFANVDDVNRVYLCTSCIRGKHRKPTACELLHFAFTEDEMIALDARWKAAVMPGTGISCSMCHAAGFMIGISTTRCAKRLENCIVRNGRAVYGYCCFHADPDTTDGYCIQCAHAHSRRSSMDDVDMRAALASEPWLV